MEEGTPPIIKEMTSAHPSAWQRELKNLSAVALRPNPTKPFPSIDTIAWHAAGNLDPIITFEAVQPKPMQPADGEARARVPEDLAKEMDKRIKDIQKITANTPQTEQDWKAVDSYLNGLLTRTNELLHLGEPGITAKITDQDLLLLMILNHDGARSQISFPDVEATLRMNPAATAFFERFKTQFTPPTTEDAPQAK